MRRTCGTSSDTVAAHGDRDPLACVARQRGLSTLAIPSRNQGVGTNGQILPVLRWDSHVVHNGTCYTKRLRKGLYRYPCQLICLENRAG